MELVNEIENWYRPRISLSGIVHMRTDKVLPENLKSDAMINDQEKITLGEGAKDTKPKEKKVPKPKGPKAVKNANPNDPSAPEITQEKPKRGPKPKKNNKNNEEAEKSLVKKKETFEIAPETEKIPDFGFQKAPVSEAKVPKKKYSTKKGAISNEVVDTAEISQIISAKANQIAEKIQKIAENYEKKPKMPENSEAKLDFPCPDLKCKEEFESPQVLVKHLNEHHSLVCRMPYCTYSCYNFQDYVDHFQSIHCMLAEIPCKRPPLLSQEPSKHVKSN